MLRRARTARTFSFNSARQSGTAGFAGRVAGNSISLELSGRAALATASRPHFGQRPDVSEKTWLQTGHFIRFDLETYAGGANRRKVIRAEGLSGS
jgi:hypothetical protein